MLVLKFILMALFVGLSVKAFINNDPNKGKTWK